MLIQWHFIAVLRPDCARGTPLFDAGRVHPRRLVSKPGPAQAIDTDPNLPWLVTSVGAKCQRCLEDRAVSQPIGQIEMDETDITAVPFDHQLIALFKVPILNLCGNVCIRCASVSICTLLQENGAFWRRRVRGGRCRRRTNSSQWFHHCLQHLASGPALHHSHQAQVASDPVSGQRDAACDDLHGLHGDGQWLLQG